MADYLGNRDKMEVHDLHNTKTHCQLDEINPEHRRHFETLAAARAAGYDNCAYCLCTSSEDTEGPALLKWLSSAAAVALWAPALLILLGTIRLESRYASIGLPADAPMPGLNIVASEGVQPLGLTAVAFVVIYLILWVKHCVQRKSWRSPPKFHEVPVLAWFAAAGVVGVSVSFSWIGDHTPVLIPGLTLMDLAFLMIGAFIVVVLIQLSVARDLIARVLMGDTLPGTAIALMIILMTLSGSAALQGNDDGNDIVWRCVNQTGVALETQPRLVSNQTTFQLLLHGDDFMYLRDADAPGMREVLLIPDAAIMQAKLTSLRSLGCNSLPSNES